MVHKNAVPVPQLVQQPPGENAGALAHSRLQHVGLDLALSDERFHLPIRARINKDVAARTLQLQLSPIRIAKSREP
jgi:hypothetical protein